MRFTTVEGKAAYEGVVRVASRTVVGLDFDGTLAPIVDDPAQAHIHPDAAQVLLDLADRVAAIAVITGRPARQAIELGGLDQVGEVLRARGRELFVFGQYGNERWSSSRTTIIGPRPPRGLATFERQLPRLMERAGASGAHVEDKGLAIAVHTRRIADAGGAFERLLQPMQDLADQNGLILEPGRSVIEVRSPGAHKGLVVRRLATVLSAQGFLFAGDDLGDLEAFEAVGDLAAEGVATLRICSASNEESALVAFSDVVVPGPAGVLDLLGRFMVDVDADTSSSLK
ncbi:MAG: trehalose-phosphatase [Nocardioidaceae bacterium]|nr:trehalose-phosphatase [Nocardioidaceae bacterium]